MFTVGWTVCGGRPIRVYLICKLCASGDASKFRAGITNANAVLPNAYGRSFELYSNRANKHWGFIITAYCICTTVDYKFLLITLRFEFMKKYHRFER